MQIDYIPRTVWAHVPLWPEKPKKNNRRHKIPHTTTVLNWLKDHPNSAMSEVSVGTGIPYPSLTYPLSSLERTGKVGFNYDKSKMLDRQVKYYFVKEPS